MADSWRARPHLGAALYLLPLVGLVAAGAVLAPQWSENASDLKVDRIAFVSLFFLGVLPLWNAVLDLASVAATRAFLRRYLATGRGWWWMTLLDILVAVLLTVVLFVGVLGFLKGLQALGWRVEAADMLAGFRKDPTRPEFNWILWMAVTNLLPTLLHLCLVFAGLVSGWLMRDAAFVQGLAPAPAPASASGLLSASGAPLAGTGPTAAWLHLKAPLSAPQAQKLVSWVYVDFWLAAALPWCMAIALWPLWRWLMATCLGWLA